ncbi:MAG: hydroxymethylbilane synthase, partial [Acidobacteriaceae bacterium]|nr:hydroxymethylbilane synthase [Acidobacteriaceae bacterium]
MGERCQLKIGSRGSQLALWQANHIASQLRERGHEVSIEIIRTSGDAMQHMTFAQVGNTVPKGMFTKEIEEALYEHRVDLAVHSLKDLPTWLDEPFTIAAIPPRADARVAFVSRHYQNFAALAPGSRLG